MIGVAVFALALAATRGQSDVLTLDQAVSIAEGSAFTVKAANSNLEKLRQRVNEAKGGLGPKATLGATYTRFNKETTVQFGSPSSPPVIVSPIETKTANATVSMPIDIAGNLGRGIRAADDSINSAKENVNAASNDLRRDVRKAYFAVLRAKAQLVVAQQTRDNEADRLKNVVAQKNGGVLAQVDVLRQEAEVQQAETDLIAATTSLRLAKESLNNAMARPIETEFDVQEVDEKWSIPTNIDGVVDSARANRPEIRSLKFTRGALAEITRATASGLEPTLNVAITYVRNIAASGFGTQAQQAYGTLLLSWPIFDSGVTRARIAEAHEDEVQAKIQEDQLELSVSLEVRQAVTNLVNAQQRYDVAVKQVDFATESYRLARLKLQAGGGILLEVTDAETALTQAKTGLVNARYDLLNAYTDLQRAVGKDDPVAAQQLQGAPNRAGAAS